MKRLSGREKMEIKELLKDAYEIIPVIRKDERGIFVKTFNADVFREKGLETGFVEEYYSVSRKNVLRGMHFQLPPRDLAKLVYCLKGRVLDVVFDLRKDSPDFGKAASLELSQAKANMVYVPRGFAHGFYALEDDSLMVYKTSAVYDPGLDSGVLWNSINFKWPCEKPVLSERDGKFSSFKEFAKKKFF